MTEQYFIGIDGGTQSSKVCIFNMQGQIVSEGSQALKPMHRPSHGIAEHPDDDLWDSLTKASRQAMRGFTGNIHQIKGIGLCTIRCCRAELKADGRLASPILNWMDLRLAKKYQPSSAEAAYVTSSSGYITHRLTAEFKDSSANYEGQWPIDKDAWDWSADQNQFERFGLRLEQLFELVNPGAVLGEITQDAATATGFPQGLPVVATANDKAVEALGAGLKESETALLSLGTYIGGMVMGNSNKSNGVSFFTNMACEPFKYLYETGGVRFGMSTITWLKELFGMDLQPQYSDKQPSAVGLDREFSAEGLLNEEATEVSLGSDGLITVPEWLAPTDKQFKKGVMLGFQAGHTRAHLYRSALEGIAMTMKNHIDACSTELDLELNQLIVSGGGSNSDLFMQILADVMGLPTMRNKITGSASLGSAICVAVAVGAYPSFEQAQVAMVRVHDSFTPNELHTEMYQQINLQVFSKVTKQTDPLLENLHAIINPLIH